MLAREAEIEQVAAERCEQNALFRAMGCRLAAARLEQPPSFLADAASIVIPEAKASASKRTAR